MAGEVVALKQSAEQIADDETRVKAALFRCADDLAVKVIQAALDDAAIRFLDGFNDEELGSFDLMGQEYDPIIDEKTGARLSDEIEEAAEKFQQPERTLRRLYKRALKEKWKQGKQEIPAEPVGTHYGAYIVNRSGVWTKLKVGPTDLNVCRRIAGTKIEPVALSRDTSRQRNWRHRYLITDETGQFPVEIGNEHLAGKATHAISTLMRRGVHVVENNDARWHLAAFLRYKPRGRIIRVPRTGWHEGKRHRWVFVLPDETLGDMGNVSIALDDPIRTDGYGFHRSAENSSPVPLPTF
jgi:hypothetical protein